MQKKIKLKIAVIGEPYCGKSAFIENMLSRAFKEQYSKTQSYELSFYKFKQGQIQYEIQLWECGHDHMKYNKHIRSAFFKNCSAAFLIFDLSNPQWKQKVSKWVEEAYQFDCFLVYAVGSKKDIFLKERFIQTHGSNDVPQGKLSDSLLEKSGVQTLDEMAINQFFAQFQMKHFYQSAIEPIHSQIRNAFITIENDQHRLTRSSLAMGRRFDNTVIEVRDPEFLKSLHRNEIFYSIKEEMYDKNESKIEK